MGRWWEAAKARRRYLQWKNGQTVSSSDESDQDVPPRPNKTIREEIPSEAPSSSEDEDIDVENSPKRKKRCHRKYTREQKEECQRLFASGMSNRQISLQMDIPRTNVRDWNKGRALKKDGRSGLLTEAEEQIIVEHIILLSKMGKGIGPSAIQEFVGQKLRDDPRYGELKDGKPSE